MKVVVFGANGRVGQLVVSELVARGHIVRAFVHGEPPRKLERVEYVRGNIYDAQEVQKAMHGAETVVSCLGSWGTKRKDILETAMKHIVPAMKHEGIVRIISLTGADAWIQSERHGILQRLMHVVFGVIAGKILHDGEAHLRLLQASELNWTVLRSPVMNEKGDEKYSLDHAYPGPWRTIHRGAVAVAMCDQLESRGFIRRAPYLHSA